MPMLPMLSMLSTPHHAMLAYSLHLIKAIPISLGKADLLHRRASLPRLIRMFRSLGGELRRSKTGMYDRRVGDLRCGVHVG